jgi:hypothetical protein
MAVYARHCASCGTEVAARRPPGDGQVLCAACDPSDLPLSGPPVIRPLAAPPGMTATKLEAIAALVDDYDLALRRLRPGGGAGEHTEMQDELRQWAQSLRENGAP